MEAEGRCGRGCLYHGFESGRELWVWVWITTYVPRLRDWHGFVNVTGIPTHTYSAIYACAYVCPLHPQELAGELGEHMGKHAVSVEKALVIVYQPQV